CAGVMLTVGTVLTDHSGLSQSAAPPTATGTSSVASSLRKTIASPPSPITPASQENVNSNVPVAPGFAVTVWAGTDVLITSAVNCRAAFSSVAPQGTWTATPRGIPASQVSVAVGISKVT